MRPAGSLKRRLQAGCLGLALLAPIAVRAADDLAPLPDVRRAVTDTTGTLLPADVDALEAMVGAVEKKKGSQILVVLVPTTQPEPIEAYSIRLADRVKPGRRKVDDGLIILLAMRDHTARIEVGYGLEGAIPDNVADRVRREIMNPHFRSGDYAQGLKAGVRALGGLIEGEALPAPVAADHRFASDDARQWFMPALLFVLFAGRILAAMLGRVRGAAVVGAMTGALALGVGFPVLIGVLAAVGGFLLAVLLAGSVGNGLGRGAGMGGWGGGGGGFGGTGGGWSGGGGGFGGGGSGGSWK